MEYRAVGNRCAINLNLLHLPVSNEKALAILICKGFRVLEVDIIDLARLCIKTSKYKRGAKLSEAPMILDCSSFIKWLYGQRGIWLPRRSIQQRELGLPVIFSEITKYDVVFVSGRVVNYYHSNPSDGVGHVGVATGEGTIIYATDKKVDVTETSLDSFIGTRKLCGIRRYIPKEQIVLTLKTPINLEVEIADDMKWIILQSLPK